MTPRTHSSLRRGAVLAAALALPVILAGPAAADVPEGWSDPDPVPVLQALLILGGIPLALFLLIGLAVYLPAVVRGERVAPGAPALENQWFGGPREGSRELESAASTDAPSETGGGSGRW